MQTRMKGMMKGRAPGIDEMHVEMVMAAGDNRISWTKRLLNTCMRKGKVPGEWRTGLIVPKRREMCKTLGNTEASHFKDTSSSC